MDWFLTIRPSAEADLRDAKDWYNSQRSGLGQEFVATLAATMLRLEQTPEAFALFYRDLRRIIPPRFPYNIFYRIRGQEVIVLRVLHAARDFERELRREK